MPATTSEFVYALVIGQTDAIAEFVKLSDIDDEGTVPINSNCVAVALKKSLTVPVVFATVAAE